jgi:8-hydroxy-5-deazaflavin:NADPH oxidoreductase
MEDKTIISKVAVFGTGTVGQTIARELVTQGYEVTIGTRNVKDSMSKTEPDNWGNQPVFKLMAEFEELKLETFEDAKVDKQLIVLAVSGSYAMEVLELAGQLPESLVVLDVTNPLDFSKGFPPSLFTDSTFSLAEKIQAKYPNIHIVKSLNTMTNAIMVNPESRTDAGNVFVCGNNADAKERVTLILKSFGWQESAILDLGDLTGARGMEMMMPMWIRLFQVRGNANFNWKIVE